MKLSIRKIRLATRAWRPLHGLIFILALAQLFGTIKFGFSATEKPAQKISAAQLAVGVTQASALSIRPELNKTPYRLVRSKDRRGMVRTLGSAIHGHEAATISDPLRDVHLIILLTSYSFRSLSAIWALDRNQPFFHSIPPPEKA